MSDQQENGNWNTTEKIAKLNDSIRQVGEWLDCKMRTGKFSLGFALELAEHMVGRGYDVHAIYNEIGILEGDNTRLSVTKAAAPFKRPPLVGLSHKHHHQPRFLVENLRLETMKRGVIEAVLAPHIGRCINEIAAEVLHEMVLGAFSRRAAEHRLTGEFIVYERKANGSNYYLTLGDHGDYDGIRARVDSYRQIDLQQGFC